MDGYYEGKDKSIKRLLQFAERFNAPWLIANYKAGDMTIHLAYMIHAATTNKNPARSHALLHRHPLPALARRD